MSRSQRPSLALALTLAGTSAACEEEVINRPRADAGSVGVDAGSFEPLGLAAGMRFTYLGQCTRRGEGNREQNGRYQLVLTLSAVEDRGPGASAVRFAATGTNLEGRDWDPTADFDPWVARLGPASPSDRVGAEVTSADLSDPPSLPPPPTPPAGKVLPRPGTFFVDLRDPGLRADFVAANEGRRPQVVDPANGVNMRWAFSTEGRDDALFYHPTKTRRVRLEYDARGFLTRLDEAIGDTASAPSTTCTLTLTAGP
jgi:hypothetical protein